MPATPSAGFRCDGVRRLWRDVQGVFSAVGLMRCSVCFYGRKKRVVFVLAANYLFNEFSKLPPICRETVCLKVVGGVYGGGGG